MEEEDGGWNTIGGCGDRINPDPAEGLRPVGVKSKFWCLTDDDDTDEDVSQSPFTPDLVRQAAVHGFTKEHLVQAELALHNSSVRRQVEQTITPVSMDSKVAHVRTIMKALIDVRRTTMKPWSGKLP
jgi:hypothetical protein